MVKINKSLKKEIKTTIKTNFKRYLSLILIIFLGSAFYVGMKVNTDVMQNSMIKYFKESNYADLKIASEIGLTDKELKELKKEVPSIKKIEGKYYTDVVASVYNRYDNDKQINVVFAVNSYSKNDKLNSLTLLQGRNIRNNDECVIDGSVVGFGYNLGDKITLSTDMLKTKTYTIVGFARNPQYISVNRGTTTLLNGNIDYFVYVSSKEFNVSDDAYVMADIKLENKYKPFTEKYNNYLKKLKKEITNKSVKIAKEREQKVIDEKSKELESAENEYNSKKTEVESQLASKESELNGAEEQLKRIESEIMSDKEVDAYLNSLKINLESAKAQLDSLKSTIDVAKSLASDTQSITNDTVYGDLSALKERLLQLENSLSVAKEELSRLERAARENEEKCALIPDQGLAESCYSVTDTIKTQEPEVQMRIDLITSEITRIKGIINVYEKGSDSIDVSKYKNYIDELNSNYNNALAKYNSSVKEYEKAKKNLKSQMALARQSLSERKKELEEAKNTFESEKTKALGELETTYNQIIDNKKLLRSLKKLKWYVISRNDREGYSRYYDDTLRLENLSKIIPLIFFVVAALITATSITRMVQEERRKIGILKSLGYNSKQVIHKYIYYASSANILGNITGIISGIILFPMIICKIYSLQYFIPPLIYKFNIIHIIFTLVVSFISTTLVALFSVKGVLKEKPSELMRIKKVKIGKKIFIEKNKKLWRKLPFIKKITYRNIFLSTSRSFMTIIGITGCTALIISSFGVKESAKDVVSRQFNKIFKITAQFYYKSDLTQYEMETDLKKVNNLESVDHASLNSVETSEIKHDNKSYNLYVVVPNDVQEFDSDISLYSIINKKKINLNDVDGAVISEKVSKILNISIGDNVTYVDNSNISHSIKVSDIAENYMFNYVYMNKDVYNNEYGYESRNNALFVRYKDESKYEQVNEKIYSSGNYGNIISVITTKNDAKDIIERFDLAIYLIIFSAGLLAFIVLYNLAKINISERTIEVATLKVMGYNSKQINKYVNNEINTLTIIGIIFGIILGYFLTNEVISACEIDIIMFYHGISYVSYIYGVVLTLIFSKVINNFVKKDLKKISMTESFEVIE